ncbi:MAG TPA: type I methionyl aminopeptidase [Tepidisphaeraceae bacterium]|nr:type I methionyl aminopeptidase [Tepidisphaeraceae bacterium]
MKRPHINLAKLGAAVAAGLNNATEPLRAMPIVLKTRREIEAMRHAGKVGHDILQKMREAAKPGVRTLELDALAEAELHKHNAIGLSKNYPTYKLGEGFPAGTCISVNEEVVHGIPGGRVLKDGDVVTLDLALQVNGYCADTAVTVGIGNVLPGVQRLLDVTKECLEIAVQHIKPGKKWSEVARLIQYNAERNGFSVVREFVGHGVGRTMHEDPKVPNFVTAEQLRGDFKLRPGMTLAVEPMVVMGRRDVVLLDDGWTVVTEDRKPAAHFEHTVAVTEQGVDVLTDGRAPYVL